MSRLLSKERVRPASWVWPAVRHPGPDALSPASMEAAKSGLALCYNVIIPPVPLFFVLSPWWWTGNWPGGILGRLLEGLMRPVPHVSGACAFRFRPGLHRRYRWEPRRPSALRERHVRTKTEAERLLAFCNNSVPPSFWAHVPTK